MALFSRNQRGFLEESLETTIVIKNLDDLRNSIYESWTTWEDTIKKDGQKLSKNSFNIKIEPHGKCDCRYEQYIVRCDLPEKDKFMVVGFLSEPL